MACPSLTAAINSYTTLTPPNGNSVLNIAMAGGLYNAVNGNSNLALMYLNVTIGRSPFTQGDVIIDFYSLAGVQVSFFNLMSMFECGGPTNITLDSLTLTNGSQGASYPVIGTALNNLNFVLNNVTFTDFTLSRSLIQVVYNLNGDLMKCHPNRSPTMTINGGGIYNIVDGDEYSTLLYALCELTINKTEFINNTAVTIVQLYDYNSTIVDSTFTGNNIGYLVNKASSSAKSTHSIANSSFTNNIANGKYSCSIIYILGDQWTITGTTFTNNNIAEDGQIIRLDIANMTMDSCTFSDNTTPMVIRMVDSNVTLSNTEFGQVDGLSGGAIGCQNGSITLNDIDNRIGRDLYDCDLSFQCSRHGNHQVCLKKLSGGTIAGIVIFSVVGAFMIIGIAVQVTKRFKNNNQSHSIQLQ
eukprot:gene10594-12328_t